MVIDEKFASDFKENVVGRGMYSFYEKIQEYIPTLARIVNRYDEKVNSKPEKLNFSIEDIMNLTLDFFKDFNPNLYSKLLKKLNGAHVTILSNEDISRGVIPSAHNEDGKLALMLEECNDILKVCTTPHEFAHACNQQSVEGKTRKTRLLGEIESKFIEKIFTDWLLEKGIISKGDYKFKCDVQLQDLVAFCKILLNENLVLKQLNHDFSKEHLQRFVDENSYLEKTLSEMAYGRRGNKKIWGSYIARYIVGELVAQVLYEDYKVMPVATSMLFDEYMTKNAEMGLEEGISFLIGGNYIDRINNTFFPNNEHNQ